MPDAPPLPWWPKFQSWLIATVPRGDWPETDEFWSELERAVARAGDPGDDCCRDAARRLMRAGFPFPSDLIARLPAALGVLLAERREAAERARLAASDPDADRFNRAAEAHWSGLDAAARDGFRREVRSHWPFLGRPGREKACELVAMAWAYDPATRPAPGGPRGIGRRAEPAAPGATPKSAPAIPRPAARDAG